MRFTEQVGNTLNLCLYNRTISRAGQKLADKDDQYALSRIMVIFGRTKPTTGLTTMISYDLGAVISRSNNDRIEYSAKISQPDKTDRRKEKADGPHVDFGCAMQKLVSTT